MAYLFSPIFNASQQFTAAGIPLAGGLLSTFAAGTSTPLSTATTASAAVLNSNPIQLGSDGTPPNEIWLSPTQAYKFVLTDATGSNSRTFDNVTGIDAVGTTLLATLASGATPSSGAGLIGFNDTVVYPGGTVGYKLREFVSITDAPYNCRPDGNVATGAGTDWSAQIQAAVNALGVNGCLYIPPGVFRCDAQVTVPSEFTIYGAGMYCSIITANNAFNSDGVFKFTGSGGPPTNIRNLAVIAQNGGAGASSQGINSQVNGAFIDSVWVSGFAVNVTLGSSDNFLFNSAIEQARSGGTSVNITSPGGAVNVSNCTIYNSYIGIAVSNVGFVAGSVIISGVRSSACTYAGFLVNNCASVQINNCSAAHNNIGAYTNAGISLIGSTDITITDFIARLGSGPSTTGTGILMSGCVDVNITGGEIKGFVDGINGSNTSSTTVTGTKCGSNGRYGIFFSGGDRLNINAPQCVANGSSATGDAGLVLNSTLGFAVYNVSGGVYSQNGGGFQDYGISVFLTDNGASTGYINISGATASFNNTADINIGGAVGNIRLGNNIAPVVAGGIPTVASAATLTPPGGADTFIVSGTTGITSITATNPNRVLRLIFSGALTVTDGSNLKLAGNFTTTGDDVLTLVSDGTNYFEQCRSIN